MPHSSADASIALQSHNGLVEYLVPAEPGETNRRGWAASRLGQCALLRGGRSSGGILRRRCLSVGLRTGSGSAGCPLGRGGCYRRRCPPCPALRRQMALPRRHLGSVSCAWLVTRLRRLSLPRCRGNPGMIWLTLGRAAAVRRGGRPRIPDWRGRAGTSAARPALARYGLDRRSMVRLPGVSRRLRRCRRLRRSLRCCRWIGSKWRVGVSLGRNAILSRQPTTDGNASDAGGRHGNRAQP